MLSVAGYTILEQLHSGKSSIVFRARRDADAKPVVLKLLKSRYPSPQLVAQLNREHVFLRSIDAPGVVQAHGVESNGHQLFMVVEDFGGDSLRVLSQGRPLPVQECLPIAIGIADALAQVHERLFIHKDINAANIVLNQKTGQLKLIDFGIATSLTREIPHLHSPNLLEGTLAYISPEQTGRMNRVIDCRSDLYSLGVTFYELLTGRLPFQGNDAMALVHAHIAKPPPSPADVEPDIPPPLCDIVMKLMAKTAEDRYQSARGLQADLEECRRQWQATGSIDPFPLGRRDASGRFEIRQKLYGREGDVRALLAAFERVSAGPGELLLVSGYSGIGKSALVRELHRPITARYGYFIAGKYDQLLRGTPYSALVEALQSLVGQILAEGDEHVATWRQKLLAALGDQGQVLVDVIPRLSLLLGPQPPAPALGAAEAQNRFHLMFHRLFQVFAAAEHPLALFLDDLQWADSASLALLRSLVPDSRHFLVVGAYRDNEVGAGHPFKLVEEELRRAGARVTDIHLAPLDLPTVAQVIADAFGGGSQQVDLLAELVLTKAGGNPFFMIEFLRSLYVEELLTFRPETGTWSWSLEQIQARDMTDNVVELMAERVKKLAPRTREVLKLAACIGGHFDLRTLSIVHQASPRETAVELGKAIAEGLVVPLDDDYKVAGVDVDQTLAELGVEAAVPGITARYKLAHDRIQQAAYSLIPAGEIAGLHLQIGNLLVGDAATGSTPADIFGVVDHLDLGRELLPDQAARERLAALNLSAGKKAMGAAAHRQALHYFEIGVELLSDEGWERRYDTMLELSLGAGEAAYLCQQDEAMRRHTDAVLARGRSLLDRIRAYDVIVLHLVGRNDTMGGIAAALQGLALLGVDLPAQPDFADVGRAMGAARAALGGRAIPTLIDLPDKTDPHAIALDRLLRRMSSIAYVGSPLHFVLVTCALVEQAIRHGNTADSTTGYAAFGLLLCSMTGEIDDGYQFGELAVALVDKLHARASEAEVRFLFICFVRHWKDHARELAGLWLDVYKTGLANGDFFIAALSMFNHCTFHPYWMGKELPAIRAEFEWCNGALGDIHQILSLDLNQMYCQQVANLMGESDDPLTLKGTFYDEEKSVPFYRQIRHANALSQVYLLKLVAAYLLDRIDLALEHVAAVEPHLAGIQATMAVPAFHFYAALARLGAIPGAPEAERPALLAAVAADRDKLAEWSRHAPRNHRHRVQLLDAELLRLEGRTREATDGYDQAIEEANQNRYLNEEAIALELAGRHHLAAGRRRPALYCLSEAHKAYQAWGAHAKVRHFEARYGEHLEYASPHDAGGRATSIVTSTLSGRITDRMDLSSALRAAQAISGEIVLDRVLATVMRTLIENAGGERGFLVLDHGGKLHVEAQGVAAEGAVMVRSILLDGCGLLAESIVHYVAKARENVVIRDAQEPSIFAADPYLVEHRIKSILCAPVLHQGELSGVLYLENNLTTGAFTEGRLELCQMLASQAAISIVNARLYASLEDANRTLEERVAERTRELDARNLELSAKNAQILRTQNQLVLKEKMASLGTLAAGLAHEIKNPLNFINNFSSGQVPLLQELREELGPQPAEGVRAILRDLQDNAESIHRHGERANTIVQSMVGLASKDLGTREAVDVNACLREYATLAYRGMQSGNTALVVTIDEALDPQAGTLTVVPQQLSRVIVNLMNNALESVFALQGKDPAFSPAIRLWTRGSRDHVAFGVRDNGLGIAPDHLDKIFTPFFTTKPTGRGNIGLGLSLSYEIVRWHGGQIEVDTRAGEFAEFTITLPRV
jgi:predicted ATPase/signal transduction histidine kinase/tRNA A-37 threonylcarbamoyl transferase component Bud32